jgi:hypothetical protein
MAGSDDKGPALERRVARLEFAEGALVVLRFPVREAEDDRRNMITDVDVLSLDFDSRLRAFLSIFECKSVRGQRAEADRLLVSAGLKKYVSADRAVLVRETATSRGRAIGRRVEVELFDQSQLELREQAHVWVPDRFGPVDGERWSALESEATRAVKAVGDLSMGLLDYLRYNALTEQPYRVLGALVTLRDRLASGIVLPPEAELVVLSHALLALVVSAIRTASRLDALGPAHTRKLIENGVMTGSPYDDSLIRIATLADALLRDQVNQVHRIYTHAGAKKQTYRVASIQDAIATPPAWLDRFMDLAGRFRARTAVTRGVPQLTQLCCYDALTGDENWRAPAFDHLFTLDHRQLLTVSVDCLQEVLERDLSPLAPLRELDFERSGTVHDRGAAYAPGSDELAGARQPKLFSADERE